MPTCDPSTALTLDEARHLARVWCFSVTRAAAPVGHVGLEPELFPLVLEPDGRPGARIPLHGRGGVLETLDGIAAERPDWLGFREPGGGSPSYLLANGGRLTFEPGGQVEHSTAPHHDASSAAADVEDVGLALQAAFARAGACLAGCGVDPWHDANDIPQQLDAPRYHAMAAYLDRIGPGGRIMMRNSCSCQVNLDFGDRAEERYLAANLLSPLLTATFASSPTPDGSVSARALAWQILDPSRTGFPPGLGRGADPVAAFTEAALAATVMLRWRLDGTAVPGRPGQSFADWVVAGCEAHCWPTEDDLRYHLSTLFFEVRPRGFLELRAIEALPLAWRFVPMVLAIGALYDGAALGETLGVLGPHLRGLDELWRSAAHQGLGDAALGRLAKSVWRTALDGAKRLPAGYFRPQDLRATEDFVERFVVHGRTPADELRDALAIGPSAALRWTLDGRPPT